MFTTLSVCAMSIKDSSNLQTSSFWSPSLHIGPSKTPHYNKHHLMPAGFLTAMRQEVTRANKGWALDTVTITNKVLTESNEKIKAPPTEGVYVYGLHLDGAGWNIKNIHLIEARPKVLFTCMPVIHMFAVRSTAPIDPKLYVCPIYRKSKRTDLNYITAVVLPTALSPDHWIMRGVALLCDTT
ncbi:Dynein heavy chain 8, axonemal [Ameca splendens]|uniref:Dynein heavy chain 8, axonemal n=2 Tax=Goodeidae TaxID=28758 RepID=A0ABV0ZGE6_9TELE